jgi:glutathione synthase/RimK-type ligase-like ATP-grasp enzyme
MPAVHVALASFSGVPPQFADDRLLTEALAEVGVGASVISWEDTEAEWCSPDAVVIRSTWNYTRRRDDFLAWCDAIGSRLHNSPALARWNSDKHYLRDLAEAGIPVVETAYVEPGDPLPALAGELVVKPAISAGGRDSGRFGPATHDIARGLVATIHGGGRTAMLQPFQPAVDSAGETAVLCIDGEPVHALRKRAVLRPDEIAPVRDDAVGAAEAMYDPTLVTADEADPDELELARSVVAEVTERFDYLPLYARVDMIRDAAGRPMVLELEAIEPAFYLEQVPATAAVAARAIKARAAG